MPRVLHVITDDAPRGAQRAGASMDAELRLRGWSSHLVALGRSPVPESARLDVPVLSATGLLPALPRLRRVAQGADVVVAHGSTTLPACALALPSRLPFVYVNIGDLSIWLRTAARRARSRLFLQRAAAVAAISERSRDYLVRSLSLSPGKVRVLPNFRDPEPHLALDGADVRDLRERLGWPQHRPTALYLGALSSEKRPDLAIDVASLLPQVQVVLAGPGTLRPAAAEEAKRAGVIVSGPLREPEIALHAADTVLLSSDTEGLPGVLIEAGLAGRPAASTAVGFVDEIVVDGETGRLAARGDAEALAAAVRDCLDNGEAWGAAARRHCLARFSTDVAIPQWEGFLLDVARGTPVAPERPAHA